MYQRALVLFRC